ncbi:MAG: GAF domain-containing protein [Holophagaceae bacterium]
MAGSAHVPTGARRLGLERRAFLDLLQMANTLAEPRELARQLVVLAQHLSGCEAVAIRLKSGPGYPYAAYLGFPPRFIAMENDLCSRDEAGHLQRDGERRPLLACLCGRVLTCQLDRGQRFATDRGSFIASSTSQLLGSPEAGCLGQIRGRCGVEGYETLGLFPIRRDDVTYGLIQCNDPRPNRLTADGIDLMEHLAASAAHLFQLTMA